MTSGASPAAPFSVGLWRIQEAVHKSNGKKVSIWTFDKRGGEMERLSQPSARERVMEVLKSEVSIHNHPLFTYPKTTIW